MKWSGNKRAACLLGAWLCCLPTLLCCVEKSWAADPADAASRFREQVRPILETYCFGCHGYGASEGGYSFDEFESAESLVSDVKLWHAVLRNVRARIMPPPSEERPNADEQQRLFAWIKQDVFGINPAEPDPGPPTLRRLNRVEYRNTVRDLTGVDYDTVSEFPPDDAGYGFDNIGDAMSVSPLLMEKYLAAARAIAAQMALPASSKDEGSDAVQRESAAREFLIKFVRRAYRRPVDGTTVERLTALAQAASAASDQIWEAGVRAGVVAVLASPRFLFRVVEPQAADARYPLVDEFSLASRLSYFLWSTMPDEELMTLAEQNVLRKNLAAQVERMLKDPRSAALAENFAGQWLRARDIEHADINPLTVLGVQPRIDELEQEMRRLRAERERQREQTAKADEGKPLDRQRSPSWQDRERVRTELRRLRDIGATFDDKLRRAMRDETQMHFDHVARQNRDVIELVDCNYAFLNAALARHYGIEGVAGDEMRRVELPAGSPRGGVLTQATILAVTSNPGRTSPVKRGLFVLNNILGYPPSPPPPPNVPPLEAATEASDHPLTIRELQERHRRDPLCRSCHARMDPLGLALENFNALGMWRDRDNDQPIDVSGTLVTGEDFADVRDLKRLIKDRHRLDFYRCLTEKLLTYALGRGLEYYDEVSVDRIVERLDHEQGKSTVLLLGVIDSPPFQRMRGDRAPQ